jgi:hypothetical protein
VGDHANVGANSAVYFNSKNYDAMDYGNDGETNAKVIGHEEWGFKLKEWEVIKV